MRTVYERLAIDLKLRRLRPQTVDKYTRCVRAFDAFDPEHPIDERDADDLRAWLVHLVECRGLATSTYLVHLASLRFLFTYTLARPQVVASVPSPIRRPVAPTRVLSPEQVVLLFEAAPTPVARLAFQAAYATGLRVGELCRLRRDDLRGELIAVRDTKGGGARTVKAGRRLVQAVAELALPGPWLLPASGWPRRAPAWAQRPVAPRTVSRWFRSAAAAAGLPSDAHLHGLRHACATHLHDAGVDLRALQVLLGHRSVATTARYVHPATAVARQTPSALDLLDVGPVLRH